MYARLPIDRASAVDYVIGQLRDGHTLCRRLASIDFGTGTLNAIVPTAIPKPSEPHLYEFRRGFSFPAGVDRSGPTPVAAVAGAMLEMECAGRSMVIAEAFNPRPGDPFLRTLGMRVAILEQEVYFLASATDALRSIEKLIRKSSSIWRSVTVLAEVSPEAWLGDRVQWRIADVDHICDSVRAIAVGAYDDEGYLLWTGGDSA